MRPRELCADVWFYLEYKRVRAEVRATTVLEKATLRVSRSGLQMLAIPEEGMTFSVFPKSEKPIVTLQRVQTVRLELTKEGTVYYGLVLSGREFDEIDRFLRYVQALRDHGWEVQWYSGDESARHKLNGSVSLASGGVA